MPFIPKPHEIYQHFKGNLYQVTAIAEHTETGEQLVIYQALYGDFKSYARPLSMFVSRVDRNKYPDARQEFRFQLQGPEADRQKAEAGEQDEAEVQEPAAMQDSGQGTREQDVKGQDSGQRTRGQDAKGQDSGQGTRGQDAKGQDSGQGTREQDTKEQDTGRENEGKNQEEELDLDPMLLEFLDSDGYEQKLNILAGLHHRITDDMITTMAIACDIEINDGETEERYEALKACLLTLEHYECNRLR